MGVACTSLVPGDARFKPGGSVAWSRTWAGPSAGNDSCRSLCLAGTRGLFAGGTVDGSGGLDAMAAKYGGRTIDGLAKKFGDGQVHIVSLRARATTN